MYRKYRLYFLLLAICFNLCLSAVALSEEIIYEEGVAYLSLVRENVTAKKGAVSKSFHQPANITVIDSKEIESLNAASVVDVLRFQQGLVVRDWTGGGKTVNVDIRGFGETGPSNVLVLVNGRRTNNIDMANVDWAQIPLDAVEKIEIIRGPSAVLYGDNATGGVINIITKKSADGKINLLTEMGSYNMNKIKLRLSGSRNNATYNIIASRNSTDGFRENSGVTNTDINAFIIYNLPKVKTSVDIGYHTDKYGMPGEVNETDWNDNKLTKADTPNDNAKTNDSYIQVAIETPITEKLKNEFTVSVRNRLASSYWRRWEFGEDRKSDIFGVANKISFENPKVGSIIGGVEAYFSKQNIKNLDKNDIPLSGSTDIKKDSVALYINDDIKLLSEKLYLNAGARYEYARYSFSSTGTDEVTISSSAQAYSIGASYSFDDKICIYAKWSSAFRMPKVDEYYSVWTGLINAALLNQITKTSEVGVKKIFGRELSGNLSLFQIDTENEIYYNPATWTNENYKKTQRLGAEFGLTVNPVKFLAIQTNYTYTDAKITEGTYKDSTVPAVPTHKASLVNTLNISGFTATLSANYVGERYFISDQKNISKKLEAYTTLDTKLSYKISDVKIFAGINNILDTKYAEYGVTNFAGTNRTYYPLPLRNYFGGVEVRF